MTFIPLNKHVEIQPIENQDFISHGNDTFEEKGTVLAIAEGVTFVSVGDIAYFDSWLVAKFPDGENKLRYLVQEENIRAKENG